jgi:type VI secretion system protein ImpL
MPVLLSDTRHDWLLQLSDQLSGRLKQQLTPLLTSLMTGPAPYRLRGVMFSPAQVATPTLPNARLSPPAWQRWK